MKIAPIININRINPLRFKKEIPFGSNKTLDKDIFEPQTRTVLINDELKTGKFIKNITLKNSKNKEIPGFIMLTSDGFSGDKYHACADGKGICFMETSEIDDAVFIDRLYREDNTREYNGAGSELVKYAVEKSRKEGYKGKIELYMSGSLPFYYKNNFRPSEAIHDKYQIQAGMDYAFRTGTSLESIKEIYLPLMELDEKNSEAFMKGKRIVDDSKSSVLYEKKLKIFCENYDIIADFCDFGDKFAVQLIMKHAQKNGQIACMAGKIENGRLIPEENKKPNFYEKNPEVKKELLNALSEAQKVYTAACSASKPSVKA